VVSWRQGIDCSEDLQEGGHSVHLVSDVVCSVLIVVPDMWPIVGFGHAEDIVESGRLFPVGQGRMGNIAFRRCCERGD